MELSPHPREAVLSVPLKERRKFIPGVQWVSRENSIHRALAVS